MKDENISNGHRWACILNPIAGGGYASKHFHKLEMKFKQFAPDGRIVISEREGHGEAIAQELLNDDFDSILVAGGDGTVHEVGSVLVDKPHTALGVISCGTGNDYNYVAGFHHRFDDQDWDALFRRHTVAVDVGICNGQYFFNGMGLGFDAAMTAESHADRERTGKSGKGRYSWIILKMLLGYNEDFKTLKIDDQVSAGKSFLSTISIGRRFAGKYKLTPQALINDGLLDLCDVSPLRLFQRLSLLLKVPKGTHIQSPLVKYQRCDRCYFEFAQEVPAHLDGELIFHKVYDVSIKKQALNLMVHPERSKPFLQNG